MFIPKTKFTSFLLAAGTLLSGATVYAQDSAASDDASSEAVSTPATPLYTSGLFCAEQQPEEISVVHDIRLDYEKNCVYDSYRITNPSQTDASFRILIPQITTLSTVPEQLYTFETSADSVESKQYYSPVFSSSGLSENALNLNDLYEGQNYNTQIPEDEGTLFRLTRESESDATSCLSISDITDNCHIYPLGCSYTSVEGGYELSATEGYETCYVFLTGTKDSDFTVSLIEDSGFALSEKDSDLKSYLELCCDWYLTENPDKTQVTAELLLSNLADYFGRSSVTVSIDLLPTIDWLTTQKRFLVYEYTVTVPADSTVFAQTVRETALSPKETFLSAQLAADSASYASVSDTVTVMLPDGYASSVVRNADNKKQSAPSYEEGDTVCITYSLTEYKGDTYSIALFKTPLWTATLKYLPAFIVIMAVFMLLCLFSYLSRKKR